MRIKTVGELKEILDEYNEETLIMCVHQPSWPLRETIGGLWLDDGTDPDNEENSCGNCGRLSLSEPKQDSEGDWNRMCYHCKEINPCEPPMNEEEKVLYIVLDGHPYEGTPYGSKAAWSAI